MKEKEIQLTRKQKLFVEEYLKDFNGSRAYRAVYPDCQDPDVSAASASRLLRNVNVQQYLEKRSDEKLKELHIDTLYIIQNIKEVVERCMDTKPAQYFDKEDKCYKDLTEIIELENGDSVEATVMQFNSKDALKGLELLGKYKSIFKENVDVGINESDKLKDVFAQIGRKGLDE